MFAGVWSSCVPSAPPNPTHCPGLVSASRETLMGKYGEDSKLIYDLADQVRVLSWHWGG